MVNRYVYSLFNTISPIAVKLLKNTTINHLLCAVNSTLFYKLRKLRKCGNITSLQGVGIRITLISDVLENSHFSILKYNVC